MKAVYLQNHLDKHHFMRFASHEIPKRTKCQVLRVKPQLKAGRVISINFMLWDCYLPSLQSPNALGFVKLDRVHCWGSRVKIAGSWHIGQWVGKLPSKTENHYRGCLNHTQIPPYSTSSSIPQISSSKSLISRSISSKGRGGTYS